MENFFLPLHGLTWESRAPLLMRRNPDPALGPERLAHLKASEYTECGHVTPKVFDRYFKFAFVRNPWDRLVSEFRYRGFQTSSSFREFVLRGLPEENPYSNAHRHIIPQCEYIHDDSGVQLVDFIGRFENLQQDFDLICSRLGIADATLPHENPAKVLGAARSRTKGQPRPLQRFFSKGKEPKLPYTSYFDDETREVVREMYAADISAFGYEFGQ